MSLPHLTLCFGPKPLGKNIFPQNNDEQRYKNVWSGEYFNLLSTLKGQVRNPYALWIERKIKELHD